MSKLKIILMLSGYQLTWLMCIFGEVLYKTYIPGLLFGLIFLLISFIYSHNKKKFCFIVFTISIPGYLFDSILVFLNFCRYETSLHFGLLPIWMLILWPSFATLFDEVFTFLSKYKLLATVLSCLLGPLTYYSGSLLGLLNINQLVLFITSMVIFWGIIMLYYLKFLLNIKFN